MNKNIMISSIAVVFLGVFSITSYAQSYTINNNSTSSSSKNNDIVSKPNPLSSGASSINLTPSLNTRSETQVASGQKSDQSIQKASSNPYKITNPYTQANQGYGSSPYSYSRGLRGVNTSSLPISQVPSSAYPQTSPASLPPIPSQFELGVKKNLGLTPSQIRKLHELLNARQKAAYEMPNPPKMVTTSIKLSLSPGSSPALIRPFFGISTSLVILDSSGEPWPVENFNVGNKRLVSVERLDGQMGSSFIISPQRTYGQTNLILKLKGVATPVVINLVLGQETADARVTAHVMALGPNARTTVSSLASGIDSRLLSVLDGVPPNGKKIEVLGNNGSIAWMMPNGHLWLRTKLNVISPAPISFVSSADGTHVYELMPTAKVLGMEDNHFITLSLDGCLQECFGNDNNNNNKMKGW